MSHSELPPLQPRVRATWWSIASPSSSPFRACWFEPHSHTYKKVYEKWYRLTKDKPYQVRAGQAGLGLTVRQVGKKAQQFAHALVLASADTDQICKTFDRWPMITRAHL